MTPGTLIVWIGVTLTLAVLLIWRNLWRAVLFVRPEALRVAVDAPADQMALPVALLPLGEAVEALGFVRLGTHEEKAPLKRATPCYDFVHAASGTFATLYDGGAPRPHLYFLTPVTSGGFVLSANFSRPAREEPGYLAGGIKGADAERLWKLHQRRLEGQVPTGAVTLEDRVEAARAWFSGPGKRDVRKQNAQGLFWTVAAVLVLLALFFGER